MTLQHHVERLLAWLGSICVIPAYSEIAVVERSGELMAVPEYAARFQSLLESGYSWINLSCYGLIGDRLVICVELPRDSVGAPPDRTSVNLSGPPLDPTTRLPRWDRAESLLQ